MRCDGVNALRNGFRFSRWCSECYCSYFIQFVDIINLRILNISESCKALLVVLARALQWSGNPYGNGYGLEMDGNGAHFVKMLWIGLDWIWGRPST